MAVASDTGRDAACHVAFCKLAKADRTNRTVASPPIELSKACKNCSAQLVPGVLVCNQCHTLVHAEELGQLSAWVRAHEDSNEIGQADDGWLKVLPLLPPESTQAAWAQKKVRLLELTARADEAAPPRSNWARKLGPLAPWAIALSKAKALLAVFKLKFLFSLFAFLGFYWAFWGKRFGIGFAVVILIHEMGHYVDIKRRGLPVEMPVFLPGFGAWNGVRWVFQTSPAHSSASRGRSPDLSLRPCAASFGTRRAIPWAALARAGAWLNVLNLIPLWVLDGGQAMSALGKLERIAGPYRVPRFMAAARRGCFHAGSGRRVLAPLHKRYSGEAKPGRHLLLRGSRSPSRASPADHARPRCGHALDILSYRDARGWSSSWPRASRSFFSSELREKGFCRCAESAMNPSSPLCSR